MKKSTLFYPASGGTSDQRTTMSEKKKKKKVYCCCIWDMGFRTYDCLTCPVHYPKKGTK